MNLRNLTFTQIGLLLFILLLPTQLGKHFFLDFSLVSGVRIDYLAPTIYVTDLIVIILSIFNIRPLFKAFNSMQGRIFIILFLINIITSLSQPIALYRSVKFLELGLIYLLFLHTKLQPRHILLAFVTGAMGEFFLTILQLVNQHSIQGIFYFFGERLIRLSTPDVAKASLNGMEILRPYGTFSHPNSLAGFYLLVYTYILTQKKFSSFPLLKNLGLFICAGLVFFSFSKLTIVAFLVISILFVLNRRKEIGCTLCVVARISVFLALACLFAFTKGDPETVNKRIMLARDSLIIISQYPFFGVGLGNYLLEQSKFPVNYAYHFLQPVHNIFLLFFAEMGLVFGSIFTIQLIPLWNRIKKNEGIWYIAGAVIFTGSFDHYWLTLQQNFLLLGIIVGLITSAFVSSRPDAISEVEG
jgi:hypothetical protein